MRRKSKELDKKAMAKLARRHGFVTNKDDIEITSAEEYIKLVRLFPQLKTDKYEENLKMLREDE